MKDMEYAMNTTKRRRMPQGGLGLSVLAAVLAACGALSASDKVSDVDFATVWGQGHTMAERTGSSTENFIAWVKGCCA